MFEEEDAFAPMIPIFALAYENHPDKELRSYKKPVSKKMRTKLIAGVTASVKVLYERRVQSLHEQDKTVEMKKSSGKKGVKIRRNDPCYCGSGKKYKQCCAAVRVN